MSGPLRPFFSQLALAALLCLTNAQRVAAWDAPSTNGMRDLAPMLAQTRRDQNFPALAAAIVADGRIAAAGAAGLRKWGATNEVTLSDKFHIGSITKSATALLAVMLRDRISLDTKAVDVFPDWEFPKGGDNITLRLLLQNRSGLGGHPPSTVWNRAFLRSSAPPKQRSDFLKEVLQHPLYAEPGEQYIYSNSGFALAGAMIERRAGAPWEELVRKHIFEPLKLQAAGFGPGWHDNLDQPWGHRWKDGQPEPVPPADNPAAIAPAGLIHCSILDLARYAAFHLAIARGEVPDLKPAIEDLYTPPAGHPYALGWLVAERSWGGGKVLNHAGSNTMFYAVVWIAPAKNCAFVVCTNIGDREGDTVANGCDQVVARLIKDHFAQ